MIKDNKKQSRSRIPYDVQVRVLYRGRWLCYWCARPVVFAPALRLVQEFVSKGGCLRPTAYFHQNWSRAEAPLLDHLGAVIDHVKAHVKGGAHDESNFVVACNKCNARKSDVDAIEHGRRHPLKSVHGKYGEPEHWDGLVSIFLVLAAQGWSLSSAEAKWKRAIEGHLQR